MKCLTKQPSTDFEPRLVCVGTVRSDNYATTNAQKGQFVVTHCSQTNFLFDLYKVFQW